MVKTVVEGRISIADKMMTLVLILVTLCTPCAPSFPSTMQASIRCTTPHGFNTVHQVTGETIAHPRSGLIYGANERVAWVINTRLPYRLKWEKMDTESSYDFVVIGGKKYSGKDLPATLDITKDCLTVKFESDGSEQKSGFKLRILKGSNWGSWGAWSKCSATCGGPQTRSRVCDNPAPMHGGANCSGRAEMKRACGTRPCAVYYGEGYFQSQDDYTQTYLPLEQCKEFCLNTRKLRGKEWNLFHHRTYYNNWCRCSKNGKSFGRDSEYHAYKWIS